MLKRQYEELEKEEEGEGWLASYSDLITDLLAVFVLLFSFALLAQGMKIKSTGITAFDGGTGVLDGGVSLAEDPTKTDSIDDDLETDNLVKELKEQVAVAGLEGQIDIVRQGEQLIVIRMVDTILFDTGKAVIKEEVEQTLKTIADILGNYDTTIKKINVEGHTDNRPISSQQYPSNWELSTGRAGSVVRYLIDESGIDSTKFSSSGYGEYHPIADNATEAGKALNRRVEVGIEVYK